MALAARCGQDPARVAGWALVKALGWDLGPEPTTLLHAVWLGLSSESDGRRSTAVG
jgi:hypothetical protein